MIVYGVTQGDCVEQQGKRIAYIWISVLKETNHYWVLMVYQVVHWIFGSFRKTKWSCSQAFEKNNDNFCRSIIERIQNTPSQNMPLWHMIILN